MIHVSCREFVPGPSRFVGTGRSRSAPVEVLEGGCSMASVKYQFRPMTRADLAMVQRWLETPHVAEWWGDPEEQFARVFEDFAEPAMDQFIVAADEHPFGYVQSFRLEAWPEP